MKAQAIRTLLAFGLFMTSISRAADIPEKSSPELLKKHVQFLANLNPSRSYDNMKGLDLAAEYIAQEFQKQGLKPIEQNFTVEKKSYKNILVHLGPQIGKPLVIGAHYDVAGHLPGADDNASGIAGLLELARLLSGHQAKLKRPIELVAYSLEEPPFFSGSEMGSYVHAESLKKENTEVELMISLEMIGYYSDQENSQNYPVSLLSWIYPSKGNFISIIGRWQEFSKIRKFAKLFRQSAQIPLETLSSPVIIPGIDLSDHRNYWQMGYPAVMVTDTAFMRNPNYHQKTDTPDTLDYARMSEVVNGLFGFSQEF